MGIRRILGATGAALVIAIAVAAPAGAAATNHSGNTQPIPSGSQNQDGKSAAGEHWVYVSSELESTYNPLAKTTDSLGANQKAPPNGNADAFNDGVTISIAADTKSASFSINETTDPSTTVTVGKVIVKAGPNFTRYMGADAVQNTPLASPVGSTMYGVSHAYVCYSLAATPPPSVPEVDLALLLPVSAIAIGGGVFLVHRRRRGGLAGT